MICVVLLLLCHDEAKELDFISILAPNAVAVITVVTGASVWEFECENGEVWTGGVCGVWQLRAFKFGKCCSRELPVKHLLNTGKIWLITKSY